MTNGDPGLQNERTALSWHRTALSLLAAAAAITKLTYSELGGWSFVCLSVTVPLVVWVFRESRARYLHSAELRRRATGRDGTAAISLTIVAVVIGLTALIAHTVA